MTTGTLVLLVMIIACLAFLIVFGAWLFTVLLASLLPLLHLIAGGLGR